MDHGGTLITSLVTLKVSGGGHHEHEEQSQHKHGDVVQYVAVIFDFS
jgi:hypothetical protein